MKKKLSLIMALAVMISMSAASFVFAANNSTQMQYASSNLYGTKGAKSQPQITAEAAKADKFEVYRSTTRDGKYTLVKMVNPTEGYQDEKVCRFKGEKTSGMHFFKVRSIYNNEYGDFSKTAALYSCGGRYVSRSKFKKTGKYIYKFLIDNTGKSSLNIKFTPGTRYYWDDNDEKHVIDVNMVNKNGKKIKSVTVKKNTKKYIYVLDEKIKLDEYFYENFLAKVNYKGETYDYSTTIYRKEFLMNSLEVIRDNTTY